jgi:hypothetical protein
MARMFDPYLRGISMKCTALIAAAAGLFANFSGALADDKATATTRPILMAQGASSCSAWKAICETRGPGCDAKFSQCMKSGCWTEGPKYGGATHCSLAKK